MKLIKLPFELATDVLTQSTRTAHHLGAAVTCLSAVAHIEAENQFLESLADNIELKKALGTKEALRALAVMYGKDPDSTTDEFSVKEEAK